MRLVVSEDLQMGIRLQLEFEGRSPTPGGNQKWRRSCGRDTRDEPGRSWIPEPHREPAPSPLERVKCQECLPLGKSQDHNTAPSVVHVKYQAPGIVPTILFGLQHRDARTHARTHTNRPVDAKTKLMLPFAACFLRGGSRNGVGCCCVDGLGCRGRHCVSCVPGGEPVDGHGLGHTTHSKR